MTPRHDLVAALEALGWRLLDGYAIVLDAAGERCSDEYTGSRGADFAAANAKAGLKETPEFFTWHHHEDGKTMLLVPRSLHEAIEHTGGVAAHKHTSGVGYGQ